MSPAVEVHKPWCEQPRAWHEKGACSSPVLTVSKVAIWAQDDRRKRPTVIWVDATRSASEVTPAEARVLAEHLLRLAAEVEGTDQALAG